MKKAISLLGVLLILLILAGCGSPTESNMPTHQVDNFDRNETNAPMDTPQQIQQAIYDPHELNGTWHFSGFRVRVGNFDYDFYGNNVTINLSYRTSGNGAWPTFFGEQDTWEMLHQWQEDDITLERYRITGNFTIEGEILELTLSNGAVIRNHIFQTLNTIELTPLGTGYTIGVGTMHFFRQEPVSRANDGPFEIVEFGDTTWLVLDRDAEGMLLLREHVLEDTRNFNRRGELDLGWRNSDLRTWLNRQYLNGFDPIYRDRIRQTNINNTTLFGEPIPATNHRDSPEADTTDRIFILSVEEAVLYFTTLHENALASAIDRMQSELGTVFLGQASQLLQAEASRHSSDEEGIVQSWWLRTPDLSNTSGFTSNTFRRFIVLSNSTRFVGENIGISAGAIGRTDASNNRVHVRPAMWVYHYAPDQVTPNAPEAPVQEITDTPAQDAPDQVTAETSHAPWIIAFAEILTDMSREDGEIGFLLHDIDGDGIPELLIDGWWPAYDHQAFAYTFRNGRVIPFENPDLIATFFPAAARIHLSATADNINGIIHKSFGSGSSHHAHIIIVGDRFIVNTSWHADWDTATDDDIMRYFIDERQTDHDEYIGMYSVVGYGLYMQLITPDADFVQILSMLSNNP